MSRKRNGIGRRELLKGMVGAAAVAPEWQLPRT
jgi:hypothetical protein